MPSTEMALVALGIGGICIFGGGSTWRPNSDRAGSFVAVFLGWLIILATVYVWRLDGLHQMATLTDGVVALAVIGSLAAVLSIILFRWIEKSS